MMRERGIAMGSSEMVRAADGSIMTVTVTGLRIKANHVMVEVTIR
jgi:hypothetical protein